MFVKICGITSEDDALLAVAMGAQAIGFVFAPSSRQIPPVRAGHIALRLPSEVITVGVFRNEAPSRVVEIVNRHGLGAAQLHGHESIADTHWIAERVPRVMKAFVAGSEVLDQADEYGTDPILIDAPTPGGGEPFDWELAVDAAPGRRMLLAGGLRPDNVAAAIAQVRPWGVDVSSGVERAPGKKDPIAIRDFITNAKAAGAEVDASRPAGSNGDTELNHPYDWRQDD